MPRFKMVCGHCGSTKVAVDAWAVWDFAKQAWVLGPMMDHQHCGSCDDETTINDIMIDERADEETADER